MARQSEFEIVTQGTNLCSARGRCSLSDMCRAGGNGEEVTIRRRLENPQDRREVRDVQRMNFDSLVYTAKSLEDMMTQHQPSPRDVGRGTLIKCYNKVRVWGATHEIIQVGEGS